MANLARRILGIIRRRRVLDELAEEIETHRAMRQQALERDGVPAADAAAASRRVMGNTALAHEDARDVWTIAGLDHLRRDLTYAMRTLRREPTFALAAGITLAVGIATVTSVFSIVDAELWKPLPFPHPDRLVEIRRVAPGQSDGRSRFPARTCGTGRRRVGRSRVWRDTAGRPATCCSARRRSP
jgi:putative ABC transport system permease protein